VTIAADAILSRVKNFPDFPKPGILFRDVTPVFTHGPSFRAVVDDMIGPFAGKFDAVAGLEARGFLLAGAAAAVAGVGLLPIRKAGKLPGAILAESFELEYGDASFEVRADLLPEGSRVLLMDDVLATGGTLSAAISLIERAGWSVAGISVAVDIAALNGRARIGAHQFHSVTSL
jgi:adenine phosphoribosyltransferase